MYKSDVKRDFSLIMFVIRIEETSKMVINDYVCHILDIHSDTVFLRSVISVSRFFI